MSLFMYLIPVVFIAAILGLSYFMAQRAKRAAQNMSPEEVAATFSQNWAGYFSLAEGETIVGAWFGVESQGAKSAAGQLAGAALNQAAASIVGVSTYTPHLHVCLTSHGRVVVAREYSKMGSRGYFKQIVAFDKGTRALDAATVGEAQGNPPSNPSNPLVALEFVRLQSPQGESYDAWVTPQGCLVGESDFLSIHGVLGAAA